MEYKASLPGCSFPIYWLRPPGKMSKIICLISLILDQVCGVGWFQSSDPTKLDLIAKNLGETTTLNKFGGKIQVKLQIRIN